jgi:hypothetical protein
MASHKARDGRLSPRALLTWWANMMQPVNTIQSQSQNIPAPSCNVPQAGSQHRHKKKEPQAEYALGVLVD